MSSLAAAFCLALAATTAARAQDGSAGVDLTATTPPPSTQAPASSSSARQDKPALSPQGYGRVFTMGGYDQYLKLQGAQRQSFEDNFKAYAGSLGAAQGGAAPSPELSLWFHSWVEQVQARPPLDLSQAGQSVTKANDATANCASEVSKNPDCKPVPKKPDQNQKPTDAAASQDPSGSAAPAKAVAGNPPPPTTAEDTASSKDNKPKVDDDYATLLKAGVLGGIAGAFIGIGLLPLLGPIGILACAVAGGALMIVARTLTP